MGEGGEAAFPNHAHGNMMRPREMVREARMRCLTMLLAALWLGATAGGANAAQGVRLAQNSAVITCMMSCNAQVATCRTGCIVPGTAPTNAATTTGNANVSTTCQLTCSTQQIACQTTCAQTPPSQQTAPAQ